MLYRETGVGLKGFLAMGFLYLNNNMEKINKYKYITIIILVILGSAFYWYSYRPSHARKVCISYFPNAFKYPTNDRQIPQDKAGYDKCLREYGLNN